ncbi:lipoprotein lipase [Culex quinquefasciatus]|uniref:Lipoprotein lipase n=1 Tax=Culex quinquefasciatus TaxID=7176 RepID=B0WSY0_CULQU|nr:lipoprotein lipase [Culex quinquefasciatus]|eukprot:XP_001853508.1 lipoprotein lipase [Culex quinquefasciatus]
MVVQIYSILVLLFRAIVAENEPFDMSVLDWDLEANMTLPFSSWDRTKWVLSVSNDGMPLLVDRAQEIKKLQDDRSFDALKEVEFLFFSRANGGKPVKLTFDRTEMLPSYGFKKDLPTKILVHGWVGDSESEVIGPLAQEYLKKGDVNVIGVIWTKGARTIYGFARKRVGAVGDLVAKLVGRLLDLGQVVDQIGMIGHSLGAHVVGLAGKKTPQKVAYIVGLDPAQPYFLMSKPQGRLADTDAQYVEVLHTNGDWLAFFTNIGTADFYPNGGKKQPGCGRLFYRRCSHKRAVTIFKESLMAKGYYANRCPSLDKLNHKCNLGRVEFGEVDVHPLMKKPRGVYYFETNANPPFLKASREVLQDTPQEATSEQEAL